MSLKNGVLILILLLLHVLFIWSNYNPVILIVFCVTILIISTLDKEYYYLLFIYFYLLPDQRLFSIGDGALSIINIIPLICVSKFLGNKASLSFGLVGVLILFVFFCLFLALFHLEFGYITQSFKFSTILLGTYLLVFRNKDKITIPFYAFLLGTLVSGGFGAYNLINNFDLAYRLSSLGNSDANVTALNISFGVLYVFLLLKNGKGIQIINLLFLISLLILGFLTQSRNFFIVCALIILSNLRFNLKFIFSLLVLVCTFSVIIRVYPVLIDIYDVYSLRFIDPSGADISNNRFELWTEYLNYLFSDYRQLLFGISSDELHIAKMVGLKEVAHNFILEALLIYGVLGVFLISLIYYIVVKINFKNIRISKYIFTMPFLVLNIVFFTGHSILSIAFSSHFILILFYFISISNEGTLDHISISSRS